AAGQGWAGAHRVRKSERGRLRLVAEGSRRHQRRLVLASARDEAGRVQAAASRGAEATCGGAQSTEFWWRRWRRRWRWQDRTNSGNPMSNHDRSHSTTLTRGEIPMFALLSRATLLAGILMAGLSAAPWAAGHRPRRPQNTRAPVPT